MKYKLSVTVSLLALSILALCRQGESFSYSQAAQPKVNSFTVDDSFSVSQSPTSAKLLSLLQKKSLGEEEKKEINELVISLIQSESYFDPKTCINGPFYATCYFLGNEPLWEKISKFFKWKTNLKGQKYTIDESTNGQNRVVNYSEIFGNAINLQASGNFVESEKQKLMLNQDSADNKIFSSSPFFDKILKPFFSSQKQESPELRKCPFDYDVTVTGATINFFDQSIQIPIAGVGCARVMYADPSLRIFMSPRDTEVLSGGGDWETAGLTTVQVRVDLIEPSFQYTL